MASENELRNPREYPFFERLRFLFNPGGFDGNMAKIIGEVDRRKQEVDGREQKVDGREQKVDGREQEVARREQEVAGREQEVARREQEVAGREQEVAERERKVAEREQEGAVRSEGAEIIGGTQKNAKNKNPNERIRRMSDDEIQNYSNKADVARVYIIKELLKATAEYENASKRFEGSAVLDESMLGEVHQEQLNYYRGKIMHLLIDYIINDQISREEELNNVVLGWKEYFEKHDSPKFREGFADSFVKYDLGIPQSDYYDGGLINNEYIYKKVKDKLKNTETTVDDICEIYRTKEILKIGIEQINIKSPEELSSTIVLSKKINFANIIRDKTDPEATGDMEFLSLIENDDDDEQSL